MNSCRSSEFCACAPPLTTFIIGTGRTCASTPPIQRYSGTPASRGAGLRRRERDAEDRVRAEPRLVLRPVELDQRRVERALVLRVEAGDRVRDLVVDVAHRLEHALAAVRTRVAVAQLDGLELPRRRARRHGRAADRARLELDVDLDGRVAARVEDLPRADAARSTDALTRTPPWRGRSSDPAPRAPARQTTSPRRPRALGALDALDEAPRHRAQRELGIDVQAPRDVDRGEEHVAELLEDVRMRLRLRRGLARLRERLLQLAQLVVEIGQRARRVRILEADRRRAPLHLARVEQRGQRLRDVVEDALARPPRCA